MRKYLKKHLILSLFCGLFMGVAVSRAETDAAEQAVVEEPALISQRPEPPLRKVVELKMEEAIFMRMQKGKRQDNFATLDQSEAESDDDVLKRLESPDYTSKVSDIFDSLY